MDTWKAIIGIAAGLIVAPFLFKVGVGLGTLATHFILASAFFVFLAHILTVISAILAGVLAIAGGVKALTSLANKIAKDLNHLYNELTRSARETAIDAFMAIVALLAGAVAFMTTGDFFEKISTIRSLP